MNNIKNNIIVTNINAVECFVPIYNGKKTVFYNPNLYHNELIFRLCGENETVIDGTCFKLKENCCLVLPKNVYKEYKVNSITEGKSIDVFFEGNLSIKPFLKDFSKNEKVNSLFAKILTVWNQKQNGYYYKCMALIYEILNCIFSDNENYINEKKKTLISKGENYIANNYTNNKIDYFMPSKLCGISYTYFKKIFIELHGFSPVQYVKKLRMQKAKELLLLKSLSVSEISFICGYDDVCYFSKVFKSTYGVSPKNFTEKTVPTSPL